MLSVARIVDPLPHVHNNNTIGKKPKAGMTYTKNQQAPFMLCVGSLAQHNLLEMLHQIIVADDGTLVAVMSHVKRDAMPVRVPDRVNHQLRPDTQILPRCIQHLRAVSPAQCE